MDYGGASAICTESRRERMCRRAFAARDGSTDHDQQRRIHSAMLCARRVTRVSGQHACVVTTHFDDAAQDGTLPTATYIKALQCRTQRAVSRCLDDRGRAARIQCGSEAAALPTGTGQSGRQSNQSRTPRAGSRTARGGVQPARHVRRRRSEPGASRLLAHHRPPSPRVWDDNQARLDTRAPGESIKYRCLILGATGQVEVSVLLCLLAEQCVDAPAAAYPD